MVSTSTQLFFEDTESSSPVIKKIERDINLEVGEAPSNENVGNTSSARDYILPIIWEQLMVMKTSPKRIIRRLKKGDVLGVLAVFWSVWPGGAGLFGGNKWVFKKNESI